MTALSNPALRARADAIRDAIGIQRHGKWPRKRASSPLTPAGLALSARVRAKVAKPKLAVMPIP